MAFIESLPTTGNNSPNSTADTEANKMLLDDDSGSGNTTYVGSMEEGFANEIVVLSGWADIKSTLPSSATINGIRCHFEIAGTAAGATIEISQNAGSSYGTAVAMNLTGLVKSSANDIRTPASSETELFNLSWNASTIDWDDVWVRLDVSGYSKAVLLIDYMKLGVFYTEVTTAGPAPLSIDSGILTVNGGVLTVE